MMTRERLLALRLQVVGILATIDAEMAAQDEIDASADITSGPSTETMGASREGVELCPRCDDPLELCCCG